MQFIDLPRSEVVQIFQIILLLTLILHLFVSFINFDKKKITISKFFFANIDKGQKKELVIDIFIHCKS